MNASAVNTCCASDRNPARTREQPHITHIFVHMYSHTRTYIHMYIIRMHANVWVIDRVKGRGKRKVKKCLSRTNASPCIRHGSAEWMPCRFASRQGVNQLLLVRGDGQCPSRGWRGSVVSTEFVVGPVSGSRTICTALPSKANMVCEDTRRCTVTQIKPIHTHALRHTLSKTNK
jgi:hypothetical protein